MHSSSNYNPTNLTGSEVTLALHSSHIDLWEHAILLYQAFEWQDAADTFHCLSNMIDLPRERFLCLLNTALIQARLRDFHLALDNLGAAIRAEPQNAITYFLMGLVEWELRSPIKAESCFTTCSNLLRGHDIPCQYLRFEFVLKASAVAYNVHACQLNTRPRLILAGLPAELLFEAPLRSTISVSGRTVSTLALSSRTTLASTSPSIVNLEDPSSSKKVAKPAKWRPLITPETAERIATELLSSMFAMQDAAPEGIGSGNAIRARRHKLGRMGQASLRSKAAGFARAMARTKTLDARIKPKPASHQTPRLHYIPRDARIDTESTKDLIEFLQWKSNKFPRDARLADDSTYDLARFIKHEGREDTLSVDFNERSAKRWSDHTNELLDNLISEYEGFPVMSNKSDGCARHAKLSTEVDHSSQRAGIDQASLSSRSEVSSHPPEDKEYARKYEEAVRRYSVTEAELQRAGNTRTKIHTAYSSSSSVYKGMSTPERRARAHQGSLQHLEGRLRKPVFGIRNPFTLRARSKQPNSPPRSTRSSPTSSIISTVPTSEFFKHILNKS